MRKYQPQRIAALDDPIHRREELRRERFLEQVGQQLAKLGNGNATPPALQVTSNINPPPGGPPLPDHDHSRSGMGGNILGDPTKTINARGIWWFQHRIGGNTAVPGARLHVVGDPATVTEWLVSTNPGSIITQPLGWLTQGGSAVEADILSAFSDGSDATYVVTDSPPIVSTAFEIRLVSVTDPGVDTGFEVKLRARADTAGQTIGMSIVQGVTVIATRSNVVLTTSFAQYTLSLTPAECANITDFTNLRVRYGIFGNGSIDEFYCSRIWFETPSGGAGGKTVIFQTAATQTENLVEHQNSAGTSLLTVTPEGRLTVESGGSMRFVPGAGTNKVPVANSSGDLTLTTLTLFQSIFDTTGTPVTGDLIFRNASSLWARLGIGSVNQVLTPIGGLPAWAAITSLITGQPLTRVDDTNVTLTLGGTPATALLQAVSLTLGWAGQLSIARGGTGQATALAAFNALSPLTTRGDLLTRDGTNNIRLAIGTTGKFLRTDGTDPSWQALTVADLPARNKTEYVPPQGMTQSNGTTMTLGFIGTYPNRYNGWTFVTAPAGKPQALYFGWRIPEDYQDAGDITFTIRVRQTVTGVGADTFDIVFNLERLLVANGDSLIGSSTQIQNNWTPTGTTNPMQDFDFTAFTLAAADRGKFLRVNLARDVDAEGVLSGLGPNPCNFTLVQVRITYEAQ